MTVQRDAKGRLLPGSRLNPTGITPGRPRTELQYLRLVRDIVTPDEWALVIRKALEDAKKGERHARTFLAHYVLGNSPQPGINLTQLAIAEITEIHPAAIQTARTFADTGKNRLVMHQLDEIIPQIGDLDGIQGNDDADGEEDDEDETNDE